MEHYLASSSRAKDIFNKIQAAFVEHTITPTPINYLVWYEYYLNENHPLIEDINKVLADGGKWHDILGFRLYHGLIKQQCTDMNDFDEDLNHAYNSLNITLTGLSENISNHAKMIEEGTTSEQLSVLKKENDRINQSHQKTQVLLTGIGEKAKKSIDFNFRDPITKLYNTKKLLQYFEKISPLGNIPPILIIDVDHFAVIQQNLGALVAENIIRFIARTISALAGKQNCYRTGDNEFTIFTGEGEQQLAQIAEQARKVIASTQLRHKTTGEYIEGCTVTGILFYPGTQDITDAMTMARKHLRLYKGRDQRNQIHEL